MAVTFTDEKLKKHEDLAAKIKSGLVVDGETIKEAKPRSMYLENLPEGVSEKEVDALAKYNANFVTASHVAVGELAADIFTKDKACQQVDAEIHYFGKSDNLAINVQRKCTFQNHLATNPDDKEVTKHLVMKTVATTTSNRGIGLKAIRDAMSSEFEQMFRK